MSRFTLSQAKAICEAEMDKYGLLVKGWKFSTDNSKGRHGWMSSKNKVVGLSLSSIKHNDDAEIVDTMRHEIAHALHYEWCVDNGIEYHGYTLKYTRRGKMQRSRNIKPHGREWKRFAAMTGCNGKATSKGRAPADLTNWRAVVVKNGTVEDTGTGCQRFLVRVKNRYVSGRKDMMGFMYLVNGSHWLNVTTGKRDVNSLTFYQEKHKPVRFTNLSLS
jgi:hypothetical protein